MQQQKKGSSCSIISLLMAYVLRYVGKTSGIVFMLNTSLTIGIFVLSWTPNAESTYVLFLVILGFALSQSIATSQVRGLYGIYFPKNLSAFSCATIGQTLGIILGCVTTMLMCVNEKAYVYIGIVLSSLICFVLIEIRAKKQEIRQMSIKQAVKSKNNVLGINNNNDDVNETL